MAIAGLVFGILGIVSLFFNVGCCALIPVLNSLSWVFGILGIILSAVALVKSKKAGTPAGTAIAGLVLSIIATTLGLILWCVCGGAALCGLGGAAAGALGNWY